MATAFSKALEILQNEDRRNDRRIVFALEGVSLEQWTEEQRRAGERVVHSYDQVGTMIRAKMFDKELIIDGWGSSLRSAKPLLMPLVREHRAKRNADEIWDDFQWLCDEAEDFHQRKNASRRSTE